MKIANQTTQCMGIWLQSENDPISPNLILPVVATSRENIRLQPIF